MSGGLRKPPAWRMIWAVTSLWMILRDSGLPDTQLLLSLYIGLSTWNSSLYVNRGIYCRGMGVQCCGAWRFGLALWNEQMNKLQKASVLIDSPGWMKIPVIHRSVRGKGGDDNESFTNHKQALMSLNPCHDEMLSRMSLFVHKLLIIVFACNRIRDKEKKK